MRFFRKIGKKKRAKYLKIWAKMYKIWKYFEKGQPHVCNYCMHETAKICPAYGLLIRSCFYCPNLITMVPLIRDKELCLSHMNMRYWRQYLLRWAGIYWCYSGNFDVHYMVQFIYFTIEFWNSIFILFVCLLFAYLLSYWNSFAIAILGIKIKRYLHVSYMQLLDYFYQHNITCIT